MTQPYDGPTWGVGRTWVVSLKGSPRVSMVENKNDRQKAMFTSRKKRDFTSVLRVREAKICILGYQIMKNLLDIGWLEKKIKELSQNHVVWLNLIGST